MTCHVCRNPSCIDDCSSFPPPALKIGSAEHKLQELLKITDSITAVDCIVEAKNGFYYCFYCGIEADYNITRIEKRNVTHSKDCPILKLERFKAEL